MVAPHRLSRNSSSSSNSGRARGGDARLSRPTTAPAFTVHVPQHQQQQDMQDICISSMTGSSAIAMATSTTTVWRLPGPDPTHMVRQQSSGLASAMPPASAGRRSRHSSAAGIDAAMLALPAPPPPGAALCCGATYSGAGSSAFLHLSHAPEPAAVQGPCGSPRGSKRRMVAPASAPGGAAVTARLGAAPAALSQAGGANGLYASALLRVGSAGGEKAAGVGLGGSAGTRPGSPGQASMMSTASSLQESFLLYPPRPAVTNQTDPAATSPLMLLQYPVRRMYGAPYKTMKGRAPPSAGRKAQASPGSISRSTVLRHCAAALPDGPLPKPRLATYGDDPAFKTALQVYVKVRATAQERGRPWCTYEQPVHAGAAASAAPPLPSPPTAHAHAASFYQAPGGASIISGAGGSPLSAAARAVEAAVDREVAAIKRFFCGA